MRERRSRDRIIYEILKICADGEKITRVVYQANTNFTTVRAYLDILIKNDLMRFSRVLQCCIRLPRKELT